MGWEGDWEGEEQPVANQRVPRSAPRPLLPQAAAAAAGEECAALQEAEAGMRKEIEGLGWEKYKARLGAAGCWKGSVCSAASCAG